MIATNPGKVLEKARWNLQRWAKIRQSEPALMEWQDLLNGMTASELSDFIVSSSELAVRMRQSSPFAGLLSPKEVWEIKRSCHAAV